MARLLDLPPELLLQIFSHLRVKGRIPWRYSKVCKHLLTFVDEDHLRTFCYRSPVYEDFEKTFPPVFPHRRHTLKELNCIVVLPEYDSLVPEGRTYGDPGNDTAFFSALRRLFMVLHRWWEVNGTCIPHDERSGFTLVLHVVSKPKFSKAAELSRKETFPRVAPVKLPLEAESQLPTINCVRSLEVRSVFGSIWKDIYYNENLRNIDRQSLERLATRMVGLRANACSSWRLVSENEQISAPLQINQSGYANNNEPVSRTSYGSPASNRGLYTPLSDNAEPIPAPFQTKRSWSEHESNSESVSGMADRPTYRRRVHGLQNNCLSDDYYYYEPISESDFHHRRAAPNRGLLEVDTRLSDNFEPVSTPLQTNESGHENYESAFHHRRLVPNRSLLDARLSDNVEPISTLLQRNQPLNENNNEPDSGISYGLLDALLEDDELDHDLLNDLLHAGLPDNQLDAYCRLFGGS